MNDSAVSSLWLHSTSLSPNSFLLSLTSAAVAEHARPFVALLDSGSSHCFVDELFASRNRLSVTTLPNPIPLRLFDGSAPSSVSKKTIIPITFSTGETQQINGYITKLDKNYSAVLGYDWLVQHNPRIDWIETKVMFAQTPIEPTKPPTPNVTPPAELPPSEKTSPIDIRFVSARSLTRLSRKKNNTLYLAQPNPIPESPITARSTTISPDKSPESSILLSVIPPEYHDFLDVFSGEKADELPPHRPYDLRINLEEGSKPTYGPIYSLSPTELAAL